VKVAGFSFIRNAIKYDYPVVEAIRSVLPLCDEFVIALGDSEDDTLSLISSIGDSKIRIVHTVWDGSLREGGQVLAEETNKAFAAISPDVDWAFYVQGDEVIPESSHPAIRAAMTRYLSDLHVDGLLFKYLHFYGSYDYFADASNWYNREIRIIRNDPSIYSYKDAQGFRKGSDEKLRVKEIDAWVYHYGWVRDPRSMQRKVEDFNKLYHPDEWVERHVLKADTFDYHRDVSSLQRFPGPHPKVMQARIKSLNWTFDYDISYNRMTWKDRFKRLAFNYFGLDFNYKNYIKI